MQQLDDDRCILNNYAIMEDEHKIIVGRDVFNDLRLAVVQQQTINGKSINNILFPHSI